MALVKQLSSLLLLGLSSLAGAADADPDPILCSDSRQRIRIDQLCDGDADCDRGEDEALCQGGHYEGAFRCV